MVKLDKDGPEKFIPYACGLTTFYRGLYFEPIKAPSLGAHKAISFQDFILCVSKYTRARWMHALNLDAEIDPCEIGSFHRVIFTGIRDPGLWKGSDPVYFPGSQEGFWHCILEESLEYGLQPEQVALFRGVFNLTKKHGCNDDSFYNRAK